MSMKITEPNSSLVCLHSREKMKEVVVCLHSREKMKEVEEREDCFILGFDPYEVNSLDLSKLSLKKTIESASSDVSVIGEKGQVACRDYPHARHFCGNYPFDKTRHESHCKLCYCFICDVPAPCEDWTSVLGHCHAKDDVHWNLKKNLLKQLKLRRCEINSEFENESRSSLNYSCESDFDDDYYECGSGDDRLIVIR